MTAMRATEILDRPGLRLIAIEAVESLRNKAGSGCQFYASLAPIAIVVCRPGGISALNIAAEPIVLDALRRDVPGLDAMIASFDRQ